MKIYLDRLSVKWNKKETDWMINFPRKCDGHLMHSFISGYIKFDDLVKELKLRGYDTKTLIICIKLKQENP